MLDLVDYHNQKISTNMYIVLEKLCECICNVYDKAEVVLHSNKLNLHHQFIHKDGTSIAMVEFKFPKIEFINDSKEDVTIMKQYVYMNEELAMYCDENNINFSNK